jgi:hypothetical protein
MNQCEVQSRPGPFSGVAEADKGLCGGVICESASPVHQSSPLIQSSDCWRPGQSYLFVKSITNQEPLTPTPSLLCAARQIIICHVHKLEKCIPSSPVDPFE